MTDIESHRDVQCLQSQGVNAGPVSKVVDKRQRASHWRTSEPGPPALLETCADTSAFLLQCGAATLAALRKLCAEISLPNRKDTVVALFSTEGMREYEAPE